jgi:hypothetical protein
MLQMLVEAVAGCHSPRAKLPTILDNVAADSASMRAVGSPLLWRLWWLLFGFRRRPRAFSSFAACPITYFLLLLSIS